MNVHANVMIKNEEILLQEVLPIWKEYPIHKWIFYDDNSTDRTVEIINDYIGSAAIIINDHLEKFHEAYHRSRMLEYSRDAKADFAIAIDADELLSTTFLNNFDDVLTTNAQYNIKYYWYNVIGDLNHIRQDPMYRDNYRVFVLPIKHTGKFDMSNWKYHTPRTPPVNLPTVQTRDVGFIHLQSINRRFYALKQLWYKHHEFYEYDHSVELVNSRYDDVVNGLNFMECETPPEIIDGIDFDESVYDKIEKVKGFRDYVLKNRVNDLVTFGQEYLDE